MTQSARTGSTSFMHSMRQITGLMLAAVFLMLLFVAAWTGPGLMSGLAPQPKSAEPVQVARDLLSNTVSEAMQRFYAEPDGSRLLAFGGDLQAMDFVAPAVSGSGQFGLSAYSLDLVSSTQGQGLRALALSQISYRPDLARRASIGAPRRLLLDQIAGVTFGYYGSQEQGEAPTWHREWNSSRFLPRLVSVDVMFGDGDAREWKPLIVELKLAVTP